MLKTLPSTDLLLRIPVVYYISANIGIPYFLLLISILIQLFFDYFEWFFNPFEYFAIMIVVGYSTVRKLCFVLWFN